MGWKGPQSSSQIMLYALPHTHRSDLCDQFEIHSWLLWRSPVQVSVPYKLGRVQGVLRAAPCLPRAVLDRRAVQRVRPSDSCSCLLLPLVLTQVWGELADRAELLESNTPPERDCSPGQRAEPADFSTEQWLESQQGRVQQSSAEFGGTRLEVLLVVTRCCILSVFENSTFQ